MVELMEYLEPTFTLFAMFICGYTLRWGHKSKEDTRYAIMVTKLIEDATEASKACSEISAKQIKLLKEWEDKHGS